MILFGNAPGWMGGKKYLPPENLSHISHNYEICHSYTLPEEEKKYINHTP